MLGHDGSEAAGVSIGGGEMAPPPEAWQVAAALAAPHIEALGRPAGSTSLPLSPPPQSLPPLHVLRSSQADALRLDAELGGMLQEQLVKLFDHFKPGQAAHLEPEIRALLSALVFGLSVWGGGGRATPGSELLNLRYRNERAVAAGPKELVGATGAGGPGLSRGQRLALGLGSVALPYGWARLCRAAHGGEWADSEEGSWRRRAWRAMRWAEGAVAAAALGNSWLFLVRGDYRTLLERLVGARLVWRQAAMTRIISFEYLNRQLVWQELSEALLLLLPMVDLARLRRAVLRVLPRPATLAAATAAAAAAATPSSAALASSTEAAEGATGDAAASEGAIHAPEAAAAAAGISTIAAAAAPSCCPVCAARDILTAVVALPCRHVFCYYCLAANTAADVGYACPLDGLRVAAMRRVGPATATSAGVGGMVPRGAAGGGKRRARAGGSGT